MRYAVAALLAAGTMGTAFAQDVPSITVRPMYNGAYGSGSGSAYVGPYRDLPGVSMFAGRAVPVTSSLANGGVKLTDGTKIANEYTYGPRPLPILDAYHGTLSPGIPF